MALCNYINTDKMISRLQNTPNAVEQMSYKYDYLVERIKLHGAFRLPRAKIKVYLLA